MDQINRLADALKTLFTETADELARQLGVIRRRRIFSGSSLVQTLVFGWLHQPQATGDQMAQMAALCHAPVTEQALAKRYTPAVARLLQRLIEIAVGLMVTARPRTLTLLQRFPIVCLQDSTILSLPDALKTQWPGCGGSNGQTAAAVKVQVQWDLVGGALRGLQLEPGKQSDHATTLTPESLPAGALRIADLGYFDVTALAAMDRRGVYFLSRIQVGTAVFDAQGQRLDLWKWLRRQKAAVVDCPIQLGSQERLACRLVALRCPGEVVRKRRQRLRREAAKKGRPISATQWEACRWTVVVTNVPSTLLASHEVWILYGARWQVELLFKAWKGGNHLDESRSAQPDRLLVEVYAKLLGILVQQWVLLTSGWSEPDRSLAKALRWIRESVLTLARVVSQQRWDRLGDYVEEIQRVLSKTARISRRRKEPSTFQLLDSPAILCSPTT
jgi:Transposase DDE domain